MASGARDLPAGFEVPVLRGPLKPRLSLGAPQTWTALMLGVVSFGFLWRVWVLLPLVAVLHGIAVRGTRQDPNWFAKAGRVVRYKRYYRA